MAVFNKESLSVNEQLDLLIARGLIVNNYDSAAEILKRIGYYHFSSYMRIFQTGKDHKFNEGVEFADVLDLFNFDKNLRHVTFSAIEKIETAYKAAISNVMCKKYGSHWFCNENLFKEVNDVDFIKEMVLKEIKKKNNEYSETFIAKYYEKYTSPELPPFWMVIETFTIGSLNKLFQKINSKDKREIISYLGFKKDYKFIAFSNWLFAISVVRNICAHHSRLFNRIFRIAPTKHNEIELETCSNNRFYYMAAIINYYLITLSNDFAFEEDIRNLFSKYPKINKTKLGFPTNWKDFSLTCLDRELSGI